MKYRHNTRGIWNPGTTLEEYEIPRQHYRNMKSRDDTTGIWNPVATLEHGIPWRHYRNMKSRGNTTGIWISMTTLQEYEFPWQHYRNMKSRHNTTGIRIPWQHYSKGIEMQAGDATAGARSGRRGGSGGADRHESENAATQFFCPEHVADCARITWPIAPPWFYLISTRKVILMFLKGEKYIICVQIGLELF